MSGNGTTSKPGRGIPLFPFLLGLALLAASLWCIWLVWQQISAAKASIAQQDAEITRLINLREDFESLLKLEPCLAKEKMSSGKERLIIKPDEGKANQASAASSSGTSDVDNIEAACVFLVTPSGNNIMTGSGFFVAPGYIATNRHVVEKGTGKVLVTSKALGKPVIGKVVAIAPPDTLDCAIVQIDMPAGAHVSVLPFADNVKKTEKIGAWGFPDIVGKNDPAYASLLKGEDLKATPELSYTEGVVSAILERQPRLIVHTAPISPGNSGGPLLNSNGSVAGINTQITLDEDSYRQASIAIAGEDVKNFLKKHGITVISGSAGNPG